MIPLITPAYLDSTFCMYELGASWVREVEMLPLVLPPVERSRLPGPLGTMQAASLTKAGLNEIVRAVVRATSGAELSPAWEDTRDGAMEAIVRLLPTQQRAWATTPQAVLRRDARHASAAPHIHNILHKIRDASFEMLRSDELRVRDLLRSLRECVKDVAQVFTATTGVPCRVTVKHLLIDDDDSLVVQDLARSQGSGAAQTDLVAENSDFEAICQGDETIFRCNDLEALAATGQYKNSHFRPGEPLKYQSTIVWPIRKLLDHPEDSQTLGSLHDWQDLIGFLCMDSKEKDSFRDADVELGSGFADSLYPLIRPYVTEPAA